MFCPKCKAEYRDGFYECVDCSVSLVHALPTEAEPDRNTTDIEWKELLTTNDQGEIALFKSILEGEAIPFIPQGDHFSRTQAYGMTVRFLVPAHFLEQAKKLLEEFI